MSLLCPCCGFVWDELDGYGHCPDCGFSTVESNDDEGDDDE